MGTRGWSSTGPRVAEEIGVLHPELQPALGPLVEAIPEPSSALDLVACVRRAVRQAARNVPLACGRAHRSGGRRADFRIATGIAESNGAVAFVRRGRPRLRVRRASGVLTATEQVNVEFRTRVENQRAECLIVSQQRDGSVRPDCCVRQPARPVPPDSAAPEEVDTEIKMLCEERQHDVRSRAAAGPRIVERSNC